MFGLAPGRITKIVIGDTWKNVGGPITKRGQAKGEKTGHAKLTDKAVVEARLRYKSGEPIAHLARFYGTSEPVMHKAVKGKPWTHIKEGL